MLKSKKSPTNETTSSIIDLLFRSQIFSYPASTTGMPDAQKGILRTARKTGISDIIGILPPHGRSIAIEVKTGKDRLRPEQIGFLKNVSDAGGIALVVHDLPDFINKWNDAGLPALAL